MFIILQDDWRVLELKAETLPSFFPLPSFSKLLKLKFGLYAERQLIDTRGRSMLPPLDGLPRGSSERACRTASFTVYGVSKVKF